MKTKCKGMNFLAGRLIGSTLLTIAMIFFIALQANATPLNVPGQYKQWDDHTWVDHDRIIKVCWDSFASGVPDYTATLKVAINEWFAHDALGTAPCGGFKVEFPSSGPNDITFSWRTGDEDNWGETDWNNGSPEIWVDLTQDGPSSGWISQAALHNIVLHEFGHALALDHPDNPKGKFEPIMSGLAWSYNDIKNNKYHLTNGDKRGVRAVNCVPEPSTLILIFSGLILLSLSYFRKRIHFEKGRSQNE